MTKIFPINELLKVSTFQSHFHVEYNSIDPKMCVWCECILFSIENYDKCAIKLLSIEIIYTSSINNLISQREKIENLINLSHHCNFVSNVGMRPKNHRKSVNLAVINANADRICSALDDSKIKKCKSAYGERKFEEE